MPRTTDTTRAPRPKLPFVVPLLALGTFLMITTEYIVAALLREIAADLHVSTARVGLLITAFAVGMIIGSPVMALATLRLPRRATLVLALAVFALGHVVAALSSDFTVVAAARVITALAAGAFWAVAGGGGGGGARAQKKTHPPPASMKGGVFFFFGSLRSFFSLCVCLRLPP